MYPIFFLVSASSFRPIFLAIMDLTCLIALTGYDFNSAFL